MHPLLLGLGVVALVAVVRGLGGKESGGARVPRKIIPTEILNLARKWADKRKLPLDWVLATISLESGGSSKAVAKGGSDKGRSYGLMQIYVDAHRDRLARHGIVEEALFNPDVNLMVGTEIMAEYRDAIVRKLAGKAPPQPLDELVRIAYKGGLGAAYKALGGASMFPDKIALWRATREKFTGLA